MVADDRQVVLIGTDGRDIAEMEIDCEILVQ